MTAEQLASRRREYAGLCARIEVLVRHGSPRALREAEDRKRALGLEIAAEERSS
jgi:hypothetical protein